MLEDFENKIEETPVAEAHVEAPVVEEPKVEAPVVEEPVVEAPVEAPVAEAVVETPKVEEPTLHVEHDSAEDVAIYTLRSLTLPGGGTIPKGYSMVSKKRYEKISHHKAVRVANKEEIKTYLK